MHLTPEKTARQSFGWNRKATWMRLQTDLPHLGKCVQSPLSVLIIHWGTIEFGFYSYVRERSTSFLYAVIRFRRNLMFLKPLLKCPVCSCILTSPFWTSICDSQYKFRLFWCYRREFFGVFVCLFWRTMRTSEWYY